MKPGEPLADLIFGMVQPAVGGAFATASELPTDDLRRALAALSVFRGPGTFARDVAMTIIRDEIERRAGQ